MKLQFRVHNAAKMGIFSCSFKVEIKRQVVELFKIFAAYPCNT